jgi:hypothetical protein
MRVLTLTRPELMTTPSGMRSLLGDFTREIISWYSADLNSVSAACSRPLVRGSAPPTPVRSGAP